MLQVHRFHKKTSNCNRTKYTSKHGETVVYSQIQNSATIIKSCSVVD